MRNLILLPVLATALLQGACASSPQTQADLTAAYNVAAAVEAAYAADPKADPNTVKQAAALLSSAQAALISWDNAPAGSTAEAVALSAAIAALVSFEAQIKQASPALHAMETHGPSRLTCEDGLARRQTTIAEIAKAV